MGRKIYSWMPPVDFDALERLIVDIREVLKMAGKKADKKDLLKKIRKRTANYSGFRSPAVRTAVIQFIIERSKKTCGVAISEEEIVRKGRLPR